MIFYLSILGIVVAVIYGISRYSEKRHWKRMDEKIDKLKKGE